MLWSGAAGLMFSVLNALVRHLTLQLEPMQAQFLRYLFGLAVMLPWALRQGLRGCLPQRIGGQFLRGALHTAGLVLWFVALPRISLADMTAIGFTGPIFVMIGAALFLREPMRWERWVATVAGFAGVLIVVAPNLSSGGGGYHLVMLASAPVFAASFLLTKVLTRHESPGVIVLWQALTVTLLSLPAAWWVWQPLTPAQWLGFAVAGLLGSAGHWCLTHSFVAADISATQSMKFLELVWAALLGWMIFAEVPGPAALMGGAIISAATVWLARREARSTSVADVAGDDRP